MKQTKKGHICPFFGSRILFVYEKMVLNKRLGDARAGWVYDIVDGKRPSRKHSFAETSMRWKRARVVEWAALEMRYTRKGIGGSNPPASELINF